MLFLDIEYRKLFCLCHQCAYRLCEKLSIRQYHNKWDNFIDKNVEWKYALNNIDNIMYTFG